MVNICALLAQTCEAGGKELLNKVTEKQKPAEHVQPSNRHTRVGSLSKPNYVDKPNVIVDAMRRMNSQEGVNILF